MKTIFITCILSLIGFTIKAQDLIVTSDGDSLNCKIKEIKNYLIYFTFIHKEEIRNTLLEMTKVKSFKYKYYTVPEVTRENAIANEIFPHCKFAITGGYSYRVAKLEDNLPSSYKDYVNRLRSGSHLDADFIYYFSETFGIGMKYNYNHTKQSASNISLPGGGLGDVTDNITLNFIGPSISFRTYNYTKQNNFYMNIALGYLGYKDDETLNSENTLAKSSTAAFVYDMGYDISISENTAIGFQLSYILGTLTQLELTQGTYKKTIRLEKENYENLSRLDFSVGIRFNW